MNIGIIGSGHIGGNLGKLLAGKGHSVLFSSRHPENLIELVREAGKNAHVGTIDEAARFGDVVIVSIPLAAYRSVPAALLKGKVVVDTNNYYPDRDGRMPDLDSGETTSSELLQKHLQGAKVVKAFNTIWYEHLRTKGDTSLPEEKRRAIFIAGDDQGAKDVVIRLIRELGFGVVDRGALAKGRGQEPGAPVYNKELTVEEGEKV